MDPIISAKPRLLSNCSVGLPTEYTIKLLYEKEPNNQKMPCVSHEIRRIKRVTLPRRRCWTEICRKIDGILYETKPQKQKAKEDADMSNFYARPCFELFLSIDTPKLLQMGQSEVVA
jgi:hypothetical protein